jgi:3-isopropylmalate dehydrogenase
MAVNAKYPPSSQMCKHSIPDWQILSDASRPRILGVLAGEGVGPEIIRVTLDLLDILLRSSSRCIDIRFGGDIGLPAQAKSGQSLSEEVVKFCANIFAQQGAVLCGPGGGRFVYDLRARFDLYCKFTPLRPLAALRDTGVLRPEYLEGVDIVAVRENIAGLYFGEWGQSCDDHGGMTAFHHIRYRHDQVRRILEVAVNLAASRSGRMAVVLKPGGIPAISTLWVEALESIPAAGKLRTQVLEIDNATYQMIANPSAFDVVVSPNMFGDVLADCGALLLGSRGLSYSGNFGPHNRAVYQTGHGAAHDLAGKDIANPIGQVMSLAMLLRESFVWPEAADALLAAVENTLAQGWRTQDIAAPGSRVIGTREMGQRLATALEESCDAMAA